MGYGMLTKLHTYTCLGSEKSWVRIPPEAAHFSMKKGKSGLSQVLLCCVVCHLHCLTTFLLSSSMYVCICMYVWGYVISPECHVIILIYEMM